jgi:hypothetical protein
MHLILIKPVEISKLYELISMSKNMSRKGNLKITFSSCGGLRVYASCACASQPCVFFFFYHLAYGV